MLNMDIEVGRIWLVVKPAVGLPIAFVAIVTASLAIHFAVLTHTSWFPAFLEGHKKARVAQVETAPAPVALALR